MRERDLITVFLLWYARCKHAGKQERGGGRGRGERGHERARGGETISTIPKVVVRKDTGSKLGNHAAWGHLDGAPNWRVDLDENPGAVQLCFQHVS